MLRITFFIKLLFLLLMICERIKSKNIMCFESKGKILINCYLPFESIQTYIISIFSYTFSPIMTSE